MITMMDEIFDRQYQAGRAAFNADLGKGADRIAKVLGESLRALHRLEWNAPWAHNSRSANRR